MQINDNTTPASRIFSAGLLLFAFGLLAAQFLFTQNWSGGGWCKPSLDAPAEQGFYAYEFTNYGFPAPLVTVAKEECFSEPVITYEWNPLGIIIDALIPVIILYIGIRRNQRQQKK